MLHAQGLVQAVEHQRADEAVPLPPPPAAPSNLPVRLLRPATRAPTIDTVRSTEVVRAPKSSRRSLQLLVTMWVVGGVATALYVLLIR